MSSARRNSIGQSQLSQTVIQNATTSGALPGNHVVDSVHHYNSQSDINQGRVSTTNQNSQIIRSSSPGGTRYETHTHQQGQYYSGYTIGSGGPKYK